jgi:enoyl-[acyl-carrier-protein] reductase (NADH)
LKTIQTGMIEPHAAGRKKGLIIGVANKHSIAWAIAEAAMREGAAPGLQLPERPAEGATSPELVDPESMEPASFPAMSAVTKRLIAFMKSVEAEFGNDRFSGPLGRLCAA